MKKKPALTFLVLLLAFQGYAQETKFWSEADRKCIVDNLTRSREELIKATKGLSKEQWNFKESPDRWSINQIVEHVAIWELLLDREISQALLVGEKPEWNDGKRTDS